MNTIQNYQSSFRVMMQFMRRDLRVYGKKFKDQFINVLFLYPIFFGISGLTQANIFFSGQQIIFGATNFFVSSPTLPLLIITYHLVFELFYDLEGNRFINYQIMMLDPHLVLLEKLIMTTFVSFFSIIPFFPMAYFLVSKFYVNISAARWLAAYSVLFAAAFCLCAYNLCASVMLRKDTLNIFWNRINHCLVVFGGFWVPSSLLIQYWQPLKYILYFNPLHFLSEGLRSAIIGGNDFMPYQESILGLCILGIIFTLGALHQFKKRIDHV